MTKDQTRAELSRKISESSWFRWLSILSVLGAVLGLALAFPSVRDRILNEHPNLDVRLDNEIPVLGISQQVQGLDVIYEGTNLLESGQQLTAIRVTIENTGGTSIKPSDVSSNDPIGFLVDHAEIVRLTQFSASSEHLRKFTQPRIQRTAVTLNNDIIIDPADYISFDLLILIDPQRNLTIVPTGKVAGIRNIKLVKSNVSSEPGFVDKVFQGSFVVQAVRIIVYTFGAILIVAFLVGVGTQIGNVRESRRKRRRKLEALQLAETSELADTPEYQFVLEWYVQEGTELLRALSEAIEKTGRIPRRIGRWSRVEVPDAEFVAMDATGMYYPSFPLIKFQQEAKERGYIDASMRPTSPLRTALLEVASQV